MATGYGSQVVGGLASIGGLAALAKDPASNIPEQLVKRTQEDYTYAPKSQSGQEILQGMASVLEPVAKTFARVEKDLGDHVYDVTGNPAYAAIAATVPTAVAELAGFKGAKALKALELRVKKKRVDGDIVSNVRKVIPTIDELQDASKAIIEDLMFTRISADKPKFQRMVSGLEFDMFYNSMDPRTTPGAQKLIQMLKDSAEDFIDFREFTVLRDAAEKLAKTKGKEGEFGLQAMRALDQFAAGKGNMKVKMPDGSPADKSVSKLYEAARSLKQRALRSQLIEDAFESARGYRSLEAGLSSQMKQIVNNPARRNLFTKGELHEMRKIIKGDAAVNFARFLGNFDIVGKSPSLYGVLGLGNIVEKLSLKTMGVPFVGRVGTVLANRMIKNKSAFAGDVIRAGADAEKITRAYLKHTPKLQRKSDELADLLLRPDIALDKLDFTDPLINKAADIAAQNRAAAYGVMAPTVAEQTGEQYAPSY
jgi:hypothetical protein